MPQADRRRCSWPDSRHLVECSPAALQGQQPGFGLLGNSRPPGNGTGQGSGGFCCQVPPDPAGRSLTHQDFKRGLSNSVTLPEQPEHSCRLQLLHSPITAEPYRTKARPLRPRRSCFAPAETRLDQVWRVPDQCGGSPTRYGGLRAWVEAPGAAPGSEWFIATAIYCHSRRTGIPNIGGKGR
jgi:hypothetical protein